MWDGARVTDGKKLTFPHLLLPVLSFLRAVYADSRDDFPGETIWGNPAVPGPVKIFTFTDDTLNNQRLKSLFWIMLPLHWPLDHYVFPFVDVKEI